MVKKVMLYERKTNDIKTAVPVATGAMNMAIPAGSYCAIDTEPTEMVNDVARFASSQYGGYIFANITGMGYSQCAVSYGTLGSAYPGSGMVINSDGSVETHASTPIALSDNAAYIFVARRTQSLARLKLTFT